MPSKMLKVPVRVTDVIDSETGEQLAQNVLTKNVLVKDKAAFFTHFAGLTATFAHLDYAEAKTLVWCAQNAELHTGCITMVKHHKEQLSKDMKMNARTVDNALSKLVKKKYLVRVATAVFMIDPDLAWKGIITDRPEKIKVFITYTIENP